MNQICLGRSHSFRRAGKHSTGGARSQPDLESGESSRGGKPPCACVSRSSPLWSMSGGPELVSLLGLRKGHPTAQPSLGCAEAGLQEAALTTLDGIQGLWAPSASSAVLILTATA